MRKIIKKEYYKSENEEKTLNDRVYQLILGALKRIGRKDIDIEEIEKLFEPSDETYQQDVDNKIDEDASSISSDFMAIIGTFIKRFEKEELSGDYIIEETRVPGDEQGYISMVSSNGLKPLITVSHIIDEKSGLINGMEITLKKDINDPTYTDNIVFKNHMVQSEITRYTDDGKLVKEYEAIYLDKNRSDKICEYMKMVNDEPVAHGYVNQKIANVGGLIASSKRATYLYTDELDNKQNNEIKISDYSDERDPECRAEVLEILRKNLLDKTRENKGHSKN